MLTRIALAPVTGRTHQLRVHLAALGCPIAGDPFYGIAGDAAPRMMLHACRLALPHPLTGEPLVFESRVPF
jgi:tRNA pseudouridine32 synthase/23S rRNA pseudouridine746 synthase